MNDVQCLFEIWAPGLTDKPYMNDAFNLFAIEIEEQNKEKEVSQLCQNTLK